MLISLYTDYCNSDPQIPPYQMVPLQCGDLLLLTDSVLHESIRSFFFVILSSFVFWSLKLPHIKKDLIFSFMIALEYLEPLVIDFIEVR
jgi:hypothetical protein